MSNEVINDLIGELPALATLDEVANVLRCSPRVVRRRCASGEIQAMRHSTAGSSPLLIPRRAVAAYLASRVGA